MRTHWRPASVLIARNICSSISDVSVILKLSIALPHPGLRDRAPFHEFVDDKNELIVVIAVLHLDVHSGVRHPARQRAELTGLALAETQGDDLAFSDYPNPRSFESLARRFAILE